MIYELNEINRILLSVSELYVGDNGADRRNVIENCNIPIIGAGFPDHGDTINFCIIINILEEKNSRLIISNVGRELLLQNKEKKFELTNEQKDTIVKKCLLNSDLSKNILDMLKYFRVDEKKKSIFWSEIEDAPIRYGRNMIPIMLQSGLLLRKSNSLEINEKYFDLIMEKISQTSKYITQEDLIRKLEKQKEVGKLAEELVLNFERNRLSSNASHAELVNIISNLNVGAGFDIVSFDNENSTEYDRFIEVKGSSGDELSFILSKNEIETSKKLGPKYWIYFIGGIKIEEKSSEKGPIMFQNPYETILNNESFEKESVGFLVRKNNI